MVKDVDGAFLLVYIHVWRKSERHEAAALEVSYAEIGKTAQAIWACNRPLTLPRLLPGEDLS